MNTDVAYCLTHNSLLLADLPAPTDFCIVVYAPVPKLPDNWIEFVVEPSPEEMARINLNARELEL